MVQTNKQSSQTILPNHAVGGDEADDMGVRDAQLRDVPYTVRGAIFC